jgi:tetratricopeptide (TPR) repeat protein
MSKFQTAAKLPPAEPGAAQVEATPPQTRMGRWEQALVAANAAVERRPGDAAAWCQRGRVYRNLQQFNAAIEDYTRAMTLNPGSLEASCGWSAAYTCNFGLMQREMQQYEAAVASFSSALTLDPDDAAAHYLRGVSYIDLHQYDEAVADFSQAIALDPEQAAAYSKRGYLHTGLGAYDEAIADLSRALQLDPSDCSAYASRGDALWATACYEAAIADYNHAIELDPAAASLYSKASSAYFQLGHYQGALGYAQKAVELAADDAIARYVLATCHACQHDADKALAQLSLAIELAPQASEKARTDANFTWLRENDPQFATRFAALLGA